MAVIVERLFTGDYGGSRRGIELFKEEIVRPLPFRDNWTKLRIGLLWGLGISANFAGGVADIGVCSATGKGVLSGIPVNYVGTGYGGGNTRAEAGSIGFVTFSGYSTATGALHYYARHGGIEDSYSRFSPGTNYVGGCSLPQNGFHRRQIMLVDIQKTSSVSCSVALHAVTSGPVANGNDSGGRSLMEALEGSSFGASNSFVPAYSLATSSVNYTATHASPFTAVAWVESAGPLDALNVAWNNNAVGLTLWGMAVSKYA